MDVVAGETWYCVDRVGERGFALREATITRTFGSQVILAQDGISVQVDEAALRLRYAPTPRDAWVAAECRELAHLEAFWAARGAWMEAQLG